MGRKPNALILQYFERGPKLQDQSNRYPHTCKSCGEHFPRGRIDSLTNHLTKKCPAIGEADRVNVFLTLSNLGHASQRIQQAQAAEPGLSQSSAPPTDAAMMQTELNNWTALGVLAEVSRQIDLNDKVDDRAPTRIFPAYRTCNDRKDKDHPTVENASGHDDLVVKESKKPDHQQPDRPAGPEDQLHELLRCEGTSSNTTTISMATAATARLPQYSPALLDPQLLGQEAAAAAAAATNLPSLPSDPTEPPPVPSTISMPPWNVSSHANETSWTVPNDHMMGLGSSPLSVSRGGTRLHAPGLNGGKKHQRARFNADRRKQVQEVRKIGACIRCRVLRKTCSQGHPCETCRKVLSPRVWRTGCMRTKFSEQLDLYSAGVQIVQAQSRVNALRQTTNVSFHGVGVEACHFPELSARLRLRVLNGDGPCQDNNIMDPADTTHKFETPGPIVMVDNETQDVPMAVEDYMRQVLPEFVSREPSTFMRVTLRTAFDMAESSNDDLLKKSLELWGLAELLDRERQWNFTVCRGDEASPSETINEETDQELFTTICLQLAASTERKAVVTSKALLTGMQRVLQDSKVKVEFSMYLTALILLNCLEKSTWAFKAWEQPNLRPSWPLEKEPGDFTHQGQVTADLLRMLLGIRKALPRTTCRESDGMLVTEDLDPVAQKYFESAAINCEPTPKSATRAG